METLAHHIDVSWLREAAARTRKDGAPGIDGQTWDEYERDLARHLDDLHERFKSGLYRAPPVKRAWIPKGEGKSRPIGIPTLEDKILQRAVTMVLEAVYEEEFLGCSWGFRPGRSAHAALEHLREALREVSGGTVLELDISNFFEELDHGHLQTFLDRRVRDGVIRRTINKWLRAGVMADGELERRDRGTPQGGVISPVLANVYLHEVLDRWFRDQVKPCLKGRSWMVRYADDVVMVFENEGDARRVLAVLPKRLARFGLRCHPEKTRLVDFRRPKGPGGGSPGSFDFLGFRHYWGRSQNGQPTIERKTAPKPYRRTLSRLKEWCRRNRHRRVVWQHRQLSRSLQGHYAYFGIAGNRRMLSRLFYQVVRTWKKWLGRRSQGGMAWERFVRVQTRYPLPAPVIVHTVLSLRTSLAKSRMRQFRTSGSVGALGG